METAHAAAMKEMGTTVAALEARVAELDGAVVEKDAETAALTAERDSLRGTAKAASGAELRAAEVAVEKELESLQKKKVFNLFGNPAQKNLKVQIKLRVLL